MPTQVFSCEYYEFLRASILKNICERLLLDGVSSHAHPMCQEYTSDFRFWDSETFWVAKMNPVQTFNVCFQFLLEECQLANCKSKKMIKISIHELFEDT